MPLHLIISPHIDDAALCLSGLLLKKKIQDVYVLNVFTHSQYTTAESRAPAEISALRQREEKAVMRVLGLPFYNLELDDASVRPQYSQEDDYMNPHLNPEDDPIYGVCHDKIDSFIKMQKPQFLWIPLSIPSHIDHRIVSAYGITREKMKSNIIFYEDVGYDSSLDDKQVHQRAKNISSELQPKTVLLDNLEEKIRLVSLYESQMNSEILQQISKQFSLRNGERIWATPETFKNVSELL